MKKKKIAITLITALSICIFGGCGTASSASNSSLSSSVSENQSERTDDKGKEGNSVKGGIMGAGAVDKSEDAELQNMIAQEKDKFQQFEYKDTETGKTLSYNLYIPKDYDASKSYPLVYFIADSSVVGKDVSTPLTQGYGALVWASDEEQKKHESLVLVPQFPETILDDHNGFTMTDYVEMSKRLLDSVVSSYSVNTNKLYATGQSMGCMTMMYLSSEYPDLFTAELFVSGQWDITKLENLASQKFFYIAAAGDDKASQGQKDVESMLDAAGVKYSAADNWNAKSSSDELKSAAQSLVSQGNNINIATFEKGTVLPQGTPEGTMEHMYSFDYAYKIEAVRDWLFKQSK